MRASSGWSDPLPLWLRRGRVDGDSFEQLAHEHGGVDVTDRRRSLDDQPMRERRDGKSLDVVGDDVVATVQGGIRLARTIERERTARGGAQVDVWMRARGIDQPDDVLGHGRVDVDLSNARLQGAQIVDRGDLAD